MSKSNIAISPDELTAAVQKIFNEYGDAARVIANETITETAKESSQMLRKKEMAEKYNGTKYASSWTSTTERNRLGDTAIAYNKQHYRLTHLLENGHVDPRTGRRVGQRIHLKPVHDWAVREVQERIIRRLEGIG